MFAYFVYVGFAAAKAARSKGQPEGELHRKEEGSRHARGECH